MTPFFLLLLIPAAVAFVWAVAVRPPWRPPDDARPDARERRRLRRLERLDDLTFRASRAERVVQARGVIVSVDIEADRNRRDGGDPRVARKAAAARDAAAGAMVRMAEAAMRDRPWDAEAWAGEAASAGGDAVRRQAEAVRRAVARGRGLKDDDL